MRISAGSLASSWVIALFLLAVLGIVSKPPHDNDKVQVIAFPAMTTTPNATQLAYLRARVWCALDGNQVASVKIRGRNHQFRGAMAIDPQWRGNALSLQSNGLINDCVHSRINNPEIKGNGLNGVPASLAFAFNHP